MQCQIRHNCGQLFDFVDAHALEGVEEAGYVGEFVEKLELAKSDCFQRF